MIPWRQGEHWPASYTPLRLLRLLLSSLSCLTLGEVCRLCDMPFAVIPMRYLELGV